MEKSLEEIGMESIVDSPKSDLKSSKIDLSNVWAIFKSEFFVFANSFLGIYLETH